jgi:ATP-dependent Zn protease
MITPSTQTTARPDWTTLADTAFARAYPGGSPTKRSGIGVHLAAMRQAAADGATHVERLRNRDLADWDIPDDDVPDDISDLIAEAGLEDDAAQPSGVPAAAIITAEDITQALEHGDDPWAMDSGTMSYRPPLAVDAGDVAVLARLAKTYGAQEAVNAALCDGAATVLLCASDAEAHRTARVLKSALRFSGDASQTPPTRQVVVFDAGCLATASNRARAQDRISDPAPLLLVSTVPPASLPGALAHLPDVTLASHCADTLLWTLRRTHSATGRLAEVAVRDALPDDAALVQLTQDLIDLALRAEGPLRVARKLAELAVEPGDGPTLADLPGLGDAGQQLAQIVDGLAAYRAGNLPWADVTNGVILSGPPGTGKTTVATALARSLGVPLIATSFSSWQEASAGGRDVMKAMAATFAEARAAVAGPQGGVAVVLIDEIDSFQSRDETRDHNSSYFINTTNALLAHLDGAVAREGVLVIGATNHAGKLDDALVRPGRLGTRIAIGHPTAQDLPDVLRFHLGGDLAGLDLTRIARAAAGLSMAEAGALVQQARQMARAAKRAMIEDDLFTVLARTHLPLSKALRRRAATCAAGRAVAAHVTGSARPDALRLAGAAASVDLTRRTDARTRADIGRELVTLLAGRAAEEDLCGTTSGLGGGDASSDLAQATQLAIRETLSYGLGSLVWCGSDGDPATLFARHPGLRDRVATRLDGTYARACDLIRANRAGVEAITGHLVVDGVVDTDTLRDLLVYCVDQPRPAPDGPDAGDGIWPGM